MVESVLPIIMLTVVSAAMLVGVLTTRKLRKQLQGMAVLLQDTTQRLGEERAQSCQRENKLEALIKEERGKTYMALNECAHAEQRARRAENNAARLESEILGRQLRDPLAEMFANLFGGLGGRRSDQNAAPAKSSPQLDAQTVALLKLATSEPAAQHSNDKERENAAMIVCKRLRDKMGA